MSTLPSTKSKQSPVTLYHRTNAAMMILADGFRDREVHNFPPAVWLSASPLDGNEGTKGNQLLAVTLYTTATEVFNREVLKADKPYREFIFPAGLLNEKATVRLLSAEETAAAEQGPCWNEYPPGEPARTWTELRREEEMLEADPAYQCD